MEFGELLRQVGDEPIFTTGFLLAARHSRADVQRQLSRWVSAGRLIQLRRGLYALAPPHQRVRPHPFVIANALMRGSYVTGQSALAYHGMIPEFVAETVSACTGRPTVWDTPFGRFSYRHLQRRLFTGYARLEVAPNQFAFVARPEKAVLDLAYLQPGGDSADFLSELRLQNLERFDRQVLVQLAEADDKPKVRRIAQGLLDLMQEEISTFDTL